MPHSLVFIGVVIHLVGDLSYVSKVVEELFQVVYPDTLDYVAVIVGEKRSKVHV